MSRRIRRAMRCLPGADGAAKQPMHVVAYDFGIKQNILRMLTRENCRVTVVPAKTTAAKDVLAMNPDGVFFSNGPGDPEPLDYAVETCRSCRARSRCSGSAWGTRCSGWRWAARRTS